MTGVQTCALPILFLLFAFAVIFGTLDFATVPPTAGLVASHIGVNTMGLTMGTLFLGHSLGGAVAIDLATRNADVAALVVESTFTSMSDMAARSKYGYLPVDLVLTERYDSLAKIGTVSAPVLFIHGTGDRYVPPAMSERLYQAARGPKRLLLVQGEIGRAHV